jgi:hypothetical protein
MEEITPPTDIFEIDKLLPELQRKIALGLDYDSIINLCKTKKKLANICKDPYFWRDKLVKDFPEDFSPGAKREVDITGLGGPEFKAKYELRLANKLANQMEHNRRSIGKIIDYGILETTPEERLRVDEENNILLKKRNKLEENAYKILPRVEDPKYFRINLNSRNELLENIPTLTDFLRGKLGSSYTPKSGHLIAFFAGRKLPFTIIYFFDNYGILDREKEMRIGDMSIFLSDMEYIGRKKDYRDLYKLDF